MNTSRGPGDLSWDLYRTFLVVMREGSLSRAARALGVTQPTVTRQIALLEEVLGYALFVRTQRGLSPTERAEELRPHAEALASTAAALFRVASGRPSVVEGTVRVSASEVVAVKVLPPTLSKLRVCYPALAIELVANDAADDLLRRDVDIAVRMFQPEQLALIARRVGDIELGLFAHRRYLDRSGMPLDWDDLKEHSIIGFDQETPAIRALLAEAPVLARQRFALRTDSNLAQLAAIRAGFGIGVCQVRLTSADPELVRIIEDFSLRLPTWVVMHENLRSTLRYRQVFDAIVDGMTEYIHAI